MISPEDREKRAAILEYDHGLPRAEAERLAGLWPSDEASATAPSPAPPGVPPDWWRGALLFLEARRMRRGASERAHQIGEDLLRLLREHGADLARLGWPIEAIAGVCPERPVSRYERQGIAARLRGRRLGELRADGAAILEEDGTIEWFALSDLRAGGLPVWAVVPTAGRRPS